MDANFEILVETFRPHASMIRQRHVRHWGGEEHIQRPDSFLWGEHVELKPILEPLPSFINARMPPDFREVKWQRFQIDGDLLDYLAFEATGGDVDWGQYEPTELIRLLLDDSKQWVVIFLWHWDQLDEVIELDSSQVATELRSVFAHRPKGFLGIHRGRHP